jgi:Fur family ferric uptake transcriptional regulator
MQSITEKKLVNKKIAPTAMRLLVLDLLLKQNTAISLTDIEKALAPADRITIYRTLKTFEVNGLTHLIDDGTGSPKYALCRDECTVNQHHDLHVHFYCIKCTETFCLPNSEIPNVTLPNKFTSTDMNLLVKGICEQCNSIALV